MIIDRFADRLDEYKDRYNIIKDENIIRDGSIISYHIRREDLESVVNIASIIKKREEDMKKAHTKEGDKEQEMKFYELDMKVIDKIQLDYNFIITNTLGINNSLNTMTFTGVMFNNDERINRQADLIIENLDHSTSLRFAYAAYQVMHRNKTRYSMLLKDTAQESNPQLLMRLDKYFDSTLEEYLKR